MGGVLIVRNADSLQAISKNGFWFKVAADQGFKPRQMLICRGLETLIQQRYRAK
jgi:hypothetical protein